MSRDPEATRTALLDAAQELVFELGFAATTVDAVIERAGVTKGAFFHHFPSKADLAHALMERFAEHDAAMLERTLRRAERLTRDPLQQVLVLVGLYQEVLAESGRPPDGCLVASYCYQRELFDERTTAVMRGTFDHWTERIGGKLREAAAIHPPRVEVDPSALADMLSVIFEGAFVLSRTRDDARVAVEQLGHYRTHLELVFDMAA